MICLAPSRFRVYDAYTGMYPMDRQPGMSFEILNTNPVKYGLVRILDVNKKHTRLAVKNFDSATDGGSHRLKQNVAEADGRGGVCPKL